MNEQIQEAIDKAKTDMYGIYHIYDRMIPIENEGGTPPDHYVYTKTELLSLLKLVAEDAFETGQNSKVLEKVYRNPRGMRTDKTYPCRLQITQTFENYWNSLIKQL